MTDTVEWGLKLPSGKMVLMAQGLVYSDGAWAASRQIVESELMRVRSSLEELGAVDQELTVCKRTRTITHSAVEVDEVIVVGATE